MLSVHLFSNFVKNCSNSILTMMNFGKAKDISTSVYDSLDNISREINDLIKNYLSPQSFCNKN